MLAQLLDVYRNDFRSPVNKYRPIEGGEWTSIDAFERTRERLAARFSVRSCSPRSRGSSRRIAASYSDRPGGLKSRSRSRRSRSCGGHLEAAPPRRSGKPGRSGRALRFGYQSLLRLAILETFAELDQAESPSNSLVEEPEAYLHPHFRRFFRTLLARLAERGHDVVCTTHDPALVDYLTTRQ